MVHLQAEELRMERQARVTSKLQNIEKQGFSSFQPAVLKNPYEVTPLTALLIFQTEQPTEIQVSIFDKQGQEEFQYQYPKREVHYIPVYELYADWRNKVKLQQEDGKVHFL